MAKKFFFGEQLLVNLEARHEPDAIVSFLLSVFATYITRLAFGSFVIGLCIECCIHHHKICFHQNE